ncbi:MAG: hypothetical protein MK236_09975 [Pedosphaera sp.]|nr:hypothetical protein [Pedosphaera sp.]
MIRKKCARSLIVVKAVVLISVDPVKVGLVPAVVKTHADEVKAGPVLAIVKTRADLAKATGINLYLNAVTLKAC